MCSGKACFPNKKKQQIYKAWMALSPFAFPPLLWNLDAMPGGAAVILWP